jgi:hypothetical protein
MRRMNFGEFDHMDQAGVPLQQQFADRLILVEAYDRLVFDNDFVRIQGA